MGITFTQIGPSPLQNAQAVAGIQNTGTLYQQLPGFGANYSGAYGSYNQGLAGLANAGANAYGSQAGALSGLASSIAQERGSANTAKGMAEAARQGSVGNMGSAALGAYGSAAGSAMGAWASNQTAYNKALSDMNAANQAAVSGYGSSRNQALAGLGDSYVKAGTGMAAANAIGSAMGGMGGGGYGGSNFQATGPDGSPIASGSYGAYAPSYGGGGYDSSALSGLSSRAFAGLDNSFNAVRSNDTANRIDANSLGGMNRLDAQHYSSREQPSMLLGQTLSGLQTLGDQNLGASMQGMNQFYSNDRTADYSPLLNAITQGYNTNNANLGAYRGDMTTGLNNNRADLNNLWGLGSKGGASGGGMDMGLAKAKIAAGQYSIPAGFRNPDGSIVYDGRQVQGGIGGGGSRKSSADVAWDRYGAEYRAQQAVR